MAKMAKVRKANRVVNIDESQVKSYQQRGYDVIDEDGKVIKNATGGKEVSQAQYNKLLEENETLKTQVAARTNDISTDVVDKLEKEKEELTAQVAELKDEVKSYEDDNTRLNDELKKARNKK